MNRPKQNNNPFAIIDETPDSWKGLIGKAPDGFLKFDKPENGVRAGFINLTNAYIKKGLNTIEKIFPVYAPSVDPRNNPEVYVNTVVKLTGIPRNTPIISQDQIYKIGKAITTHEEGSFWVTQKDFDAGFNAAMNSSSFLSAMKKASGGIGVVLLLGLFLYLIVKPYA